MTLFIIATLAVWRATIMIAEDEEGPFGAFAFIRERVDPHQKTWIGRGIRCSWCVSFWSAFVAAVWLNFFGLVPDALFPLWWFGLSGGSVLISNIMERLSRRR